MDENKAAPTVDEKKLTARERMKEITDSIEAGIKDLFDSEKYKNYLRTMSKFYNYSFNNTMLIHMQMPEATRVASFNRWKDKFHRSVKRGEHGIKIIAPTPYIKKVEEMKRDPETNAPLVDANGEVIMEEKQVKIPRFKIVTVFDVSQTYGEPLPQLASDLTGDVQQFDIFMEAVRRSLPVPLATSAPSCSASPFCSQKNTSTRESCRMAFFTIMLSQKICLGFDDKPHLWISGLNARKNSHNVRLEVFA